MSRRYCLEQYSLTFDSYNLSNSSSKMVSELWERYDIDDLFLTKCFISTYSLRMANYEFLHYPPSTSPRNFSDELQQWKKFHKNIHQYRKRNIWMTTKSQYHSDSINLKEKSLRINEWSWKRIRETIWRDLDCENISQVHIHKW